MVLFKKINIIVNLVSNIYYTSNFTLTFEVNNITKNFVE